MIPFKAIDCRRLSNRCMVAGVLVLCGTVLLMLVANNNSRLARRQQNTVSSWLQAAQRHVQALRLGATATQLLSSSLSQRSPSSFNKPGSTLATGSSRHFPEPAMRTTLTSRLRKPPLYPPDFRLSNLNNFSFFINNDVCGEAAVDMVLVVTSNTRTPSHRAAIRTALPQSTLAELRMRRVFLLAQLPAPVSNISYDHRIAAVQAENHEHGDIVSGSFQDAYRNLTYKHLMGLHWATAYCPQASYIVKMDDDSALDVFQLHERLTTAPRTMTIIGALYADTMPIREKNNKWYVTFEEFAEERYPNYMSGWMYVITPDAARRLVTAAASIPFFWVDDAFITGVVRERAVPEIHMVDMDQIWSRPDETGNVISPFTMEIDCLYECAVETDASRGVCDTLVGPSWNNKVVLRLFTKQAEYCYRHRCRRRRRMPVVCRHGSTARRLHGGLALSESDLGDVSR